MGRESGRLFEARCARSVSCQHGAPRGASCRSCEDAQRAGPSPDVPAGTQSRAALAHRVYDVLESEAAAPAGERIAFTLWFSDTASDPESEYRFGNELGIQACFQRDPQGRAFRLTCSSGNSATVQRLLAATNHRLAEIEPPTSGEP
jgi:hypothetical protein